MYIMVVVGQLYRGQGREVGLSLFLCRSRSVRSGRVGAAQFRQTDVKGGKVAQVKDSRFCISEPLYWTRCPTLYTLAHRRSS